MNKKKGGKFTTEREKEKKKKNSIWDWVSVCMFIAQRPNCCIMFIFISIYIIIKIIIVILLIGFLNSKYNLTMEKGMSHLYYSMAQN